MYSFLKGFLVLQKQFQNGSFHCCEQVLFTTLFDKNSNKKRHKTKSLWYICSKWHTGERSERFLWDNMYVKQQGNDLMINPWWNDQQNAQMLQDELKCKQSLCKDLENKRWSKI